MARNLPLMAGSGSVERLFTILKRSPILRANTVAPHNTCTATHAGDSLAGAKQVLLIVAYYILHHSPSDWTQSSSSHLPFSSAMSRCC